VAPQDIMNSKGFTTQLKKVNRRLAEIEVLCDEWNRQIESERKSLEAQGVDWWEALETTHKRSVEQIASGDCPVDLKEL
jgi:hypothetical protein